MSVMEEGAPQNLLAPVLRGPRRSGEQFQDVLRCERRREQAMVLGLPEHGHLVDRLAPAGQCGQAAVQGTVQRQGEVLRAQPPHRRQRGGMGGGSRQHQPLLAGDVRVGLAARRHRWRGAGQRARVGRERRAQAVEEGGEGVGPPQRQGDGVRQRGVGGRVDEPFGVAEDGAAGMVGPDHPCIRGGVRGVGAGPGQSVEVGGGQPAGVGAGVVEDGCDPDRLLGVEGRGWRGERGHRCEQRAVPGGGEVLGAERADRLDPVRVEEKRAEECLLGVVDGRVRGDVLQAEVWLGQPVVEHQAARMKSDRVRVLSRCGARRWAASSGGTALPIWENCWPLFPAQG